MKMRLDGCFKAILFLGLCVGLSAHATVFKKECGEYRYIVELYNGFDTNKRNYRLYFQGQNGKRRLFYQTYSRIKLEAACIKDKAARNLMFFREIGGGDVSRREQYGILDPHSNKMLLKPVYWERKNLLEVEAILGYPPPIPKYKKGDVFFCCDNRMYDSDE